MKKMKKVNTAPQRGSSRLLSAIENKNIEEICTLMSQLGGYVNHKNSDGFSALHEAARIGDAEILSLFVSEKNVDVDVKDIRGLTPLNYVLERENLDAAKILIDAGANINTQDENGNTPLHHLIKNKVNFKTVESFLMKFKIDVNVKNSRGENPLFTAVEFDGIEVIKVLIDHGCDIKCISKDRSTLLSQAAVSNVGDSHFEVAEMLLIEGVYVNVQKKDGNTALHKLVENADVRMIQLFLDFKADVGIKNSEGEIPLFRAVTKRNAKTVQLLLDHDPDQIKNLDKYGSSVLHKLARLNSGNSYLQTAEILLSKGADVNAQDRDGFTPLHWLIRYAQVETVQLFLKFGADINLKNSVDEIPLFMAVCGNNLEVVQLLLDRGSDVNSIEENESTPLHLAATCNEDDNYFDVIELLLKSGANVNLQDQDGNTPLHHLVCQKNVKTTQLFLNFKPDVTIKNKTGETALFPSIKSHNIEIVEILVDHGFNVNSIDNDGSTALHWAVNYLAKTNTKIMKCLLKNGADASALDFGKQTPLKLLLKKAWLVDKPLPYLLKYSDINLIDQRGKNLLSVRTYENDQKFVLEHIAKMQALDFPIHSSILKTISNQAKLYGYFTKCQEELVLAKSTKLDYCWVTFFDLLVDSGKKLKNYAGNKDLLYSFQCSDCLKKFPIYGPTIEKRIKRGFEKRKLFDESAYLLSYSWPIFSPTHLVIRNTLDYLATEDYSKFCS